MLTHSQFASVDLDMSDSSLNILRRYQYDPLDRLTGVGLLAGDSTQRFYQVNHLTTELGQQTQRTILRHEAQPLAQQQSAAGVTEKTLMVTDQAHSLLQSLSPVNSRKFSYTAYGHHPIVSGLSRLFGFNGEYPDDITGHYPLGHGNRFYNPVLMRFNSPDELSPFDEGGINSYAYCENDPINFFDPTGNSKLRMLSIRVNRSRASVIIRPQRGSVITKHSSIIKAPSQTSSAVSSPISTNSNPMLNALLDQTPANFQQPGPSRSTFARSQTIEPPATPHHQANNPSIAIYKNKKPREFEIVFGLEANPLDHANLVELKYILNLTTQINQIGISEKTRRILWHRRNNAINKVKSRALHLREKDNAAIRH